MRLGDSRTRFSGTASGDAHATRFDNEVVEVVRMRNVVTTTTRNGRPAVGSVAKPEQRWGLALAAMAVVGLATRAIADPMMSRAAAIAGVCLVLWLTEVIPLYATTLLLWVSIALWLAPLDQAFALHRVTSVAASPVMMLFFGGFVLSVAGAKYGIDAYIAGWMVRLSRGRRRLLLLAIMTGTAVLSMWMSNIAASAMMVATLRPLFAHHRDDARFRTALMLGVAFAADFGGIATPIGTGPNLIAIGALSAHHHITFFDWMLFGVPTAGLM